MRDLQTLTALIQTELGVKTDGRWGPVTATAVLSRLKNRDSRPKTEDGGDGETGETPVLLSDNLFDTRSEKNLMTLDPKAQPRFRNFLALAQGVAGSLGCEYRMISGHRTWAEQDALFAKGRTVTRAAGGYSWHNFGIAADFGVFRDGAYLDGGAETQQVYAQRVHKAVSLIAAEAGMTWGGNWKSLVDTPHFQLAGFPASPTEAHRALYRKTGSVL